MKQQVLPLLVLLYGASCSAAEFAPPVRLKAGGTPIRVESPGYAAPCWVDVDGKKELFVGQFKGGKIKVYKHLAKEDFAKGVWLQAEGQVAEVPGVW